MNAETRKLSYSRGHKLMEAFALKQKYEGGIWSCVEIYKTVRRIDAYMHTKAEQYCNGVIDESKYFKAEKSALNRLDDILCFKKKGIPVIINSDPRGYALKVDNEYMRTHNLNLEQDRGGYGILVPES